MAEEISEEQADAVAAIFDLCEAIQTGLSTEDLAKGLALSIESGHEQVEICLTMASAAVRLAKEAGE